MKTFVEGQVWTREYPVRYSGISFFARMTVIRLSDGRLMLHSPAPMDEDTCKEIDALGEVAFIVAPGSFHYFHVPAAQQAYPGAQTFICPGVEQKQPQLQFDHFLDDTPPQEWADTFDQVLVRGARFIWEVAFFHHPSRTLVLVDLIENIGDNTRGAGLGIELWWRLVFRMWNKARPAPEYQLGWKDKQAARESLEKILAWDFEQIVLSHGDLVTENAQAVAREAWKTPLKHREK